MSKLIELAQGSGPQIITRYGLDRVVVLSIADYRALTARKPDLLELLIGGPKLDSFEVERDRDTGREIGL